MSDVYSCVCVSIGFCFLRLVASIMPVFRGVCKWKILPNLVHIIGENVRYIEPFLAEGERVCQGGGSYNDSL